MDIPPGGEGRGSWGVTTVRVLSKMKWGTREKSVEPAGSAVTDSNNLQPDERAQPIASTDSLLSLRNGK